MSGSTRTVTDGPPERRAEAAEGFARPHASSPDPRRSGWRGRLGGGRAAYVVYAGGAVAAVVALQALPAVAASAWQVSDRLIVFIATTVVSVQVGQTVGIQTLLGARLPARAKQLGISLGVVGGATVTVAGAAGAGLVGGAVLGGVLGIATAGRTTDLLVPGGRVAYQRAYCIRNLLWVAALCAVGAAGALDARSFVALTVGSWFLADHLDRATRPPAAGAVPPSAPAAGIATIAVGVGSALLYRNDVNVVRLAAVDGAAFVAVHSALLVHTFAVAVVGFATAQLLYPALRANRGPSPALLLGLRRGFAASLALAAVLVATGAVTGGPWHDAGLLAGGTAVAVWTPLASAVLHHARRSLAVYLPVLACFGGLALVVGRAPAAAFLGYNVAVAVAMAAGVSLLGRHRPDAPAPGEPPVVPAPSTGHAR